MTGRPSFPCEHHHAHRSGLNERLEVGPGAPLVAVDARVHNRGGRLRREQCQQFLVLGGKRPASRFFGEKEMADVHAAVTQWRTLKRSGENGSRFKSEREHIAREVVEAQRPGQVPEVVDQAQAVRPGDHPFLFLGGKAGSDVVLEFAGFIGCYDDAVPGAGERPGARDHFGKHRVEVEAGADAQHGGDKLGGSPPRGFRPGAGLFVPCHRPCVSQRERNAVSGIGFMSDPSYAHSYPDNLIIIIYE